MASDMGYRNNKDREARDHSSCSSAYQDCVKPLPAAIFISSLGISSKLINCSNTDPCLPPVPPLSIVSMRTFPLAVLTLNPGLLHLRVADCQLRRSAGNGC